MLVTAYEALKFLHLVLPIWYHYSCVVNNRCISIFFLESRCSWLTETCVMVFFARLFPFHWLRLAFAMTNPVSETNFYAPHQQQMPVDEYPQRPGQPDCSSWKLETINTKLIVDLTILSFKVPSQRHVLLATRVCLWDL